MNWDDPIARATLLEKVGLKEYNRQLDEHHVASTIETVNGHKIRPVSSMWGRLYIVGETRHAFSTLEAARKYAEDLPTPVNIVMGAATGVFAGDK